jgi:hypothetical protein
MDETAMSLWMPEIVSPHATCEYSWIRPPSRSQRRTRTFAPEAGGCGRPAGGCCLQCPMWPMHVVMIDVLIKDQSQVPLAGDQHPVQALTPGAGDPAFRDRVRARRLDRRLDDPDPGCREHGVERVGELGVPVRIRNFSPSVWSSRFISRLRTCWVTHSPVGCAVIPARCTRRVPCSMKN